MIFIRRKNKKKQKMHLKVNITIAGYTHNNNISCKNKKGCKEDHKVSTIDFSFS